MPKLVFDGYEFDVEEAAWSGPVTGREIKRRVAERLGREPDGAPYVARGGELVHVAADEVVDVGPGDKVGFTPTFETAGLGGSPDARLP